MKLHPLLSASFCEEGFREEGKVGFAKAGPRGYSLGKKDLPELKPRPLLYFGLVSPGG